MHAERNDPKPVHPPPFCVPVRLRLTARAPLRLSYCCCCRCCCPPGHGHLLPAAARRLPASSTVCPTPGRNRSEPRQTQLWASFASTMHAPARSLCRRRWPPLPRRCRRRRRAAAGCWCCWCCWCWPARGGHQVAADPAGLWAPCSAGVGCPIRSSAVRLRLSGGAAARCCAAGHSRPLTTAMRCPVCPCPLCPDSPLPALCRTHADDRRRLGAGPCSAIHSRNFYERHWQYTRTVWLLIRAHI